jgi:hypothetical protein
VLFLCANFCLIANDIDTSGRKVPVRQIPQVIYVGDYGKLVWPLNKLSSMPANVKITVMDGSHFNEDSSIQTAEDAPDAVKNNPDIVIHSAHLDSAGKNLVIEFQAYRTGIIKLPVIFLGDEKIEGLEVQISSLIDSGTGAMALAPPAMPLSAPGTFWIIATVVLSVIIVLLAAFIFWKKGIYFFSNFNKNIRSFLLIRKILFTVNKIQKYLLKEKITAPCAAASLSFELRNFFSNFWNIPCVSMAPEEFLTVTIPDESKKQDMFSFFKKSDSLRFSGEAITLSAAQEIIQDARNILCSLKG